MPALLEVKEAKQVMIEAQEWSVVRWLREKKRVRKIADRANSALDHSIEQTTRGWSPDLLAAGSEVRRNGQETESLKFARDFKHAYELARRAREDAESTFDEAERQFSARLAREGCRKAILSWELHEKVIRKAESASTAPPASPKS